jgi:hypothetical protein
MLRLYDPIADYERLTLVSAVLMTARRSVSYGLFSAWCSGRAVDPGSNVRPGGVRLDFGCAAFAALAVSTALAEEVVWRGRGRLYGALVRCHTAAGDTLDRACAAGRWRACRVRGLGGWRARLQDAGRQHLRHGRGRRSRPCARFPGQPCRSRATPSAWWRPPMGAGHSSRSTAPSTPAGRTGQDGRSLWAEWWGEEVACWHCGLCRGPDCSAPIRPGGLVRPAGDGWPLAW